MRVRAPLLPAWLRWLAVVAVAAVILVFSVILAPPETVIDRARFEIIPLDKWRHFLAYAAFGGALAYATTDWTADDRVLAAGVLGATVLYGVGIEVWQSFVPDRYFSLVDAYANALGAVLVLPWYLLRPRLDFVPVRSWLRTVAPGE